MRVVTRAFLSVTDKRGLPEFGRGLADLGIELVSTGGTAKALRASGLQVKDVSDVTGFPEMMDGRVKTLHPKIHAGILAIRDEPTHMASLKEHDIAEIGLVCVNFYPFEQIIAKPGCTFAEAIEGIDIGGPTAVRAAVKNYGYVYGVIDPDDYTEVLHRLKDRSGAVDPAYSLELAKKVIRRTRAYETAIDEYLSKYSFSS